MTTQRLAATASPPLMTMTTDLLRTPLHDWHVAHGGRMVDFAGWSMPVQYTSIAEEHNATRNAVGVFDISHMGRLTFNRNSAEVPVFLDSVVTRRVVDMKPQQVRYALVCNEKGGILDDVLVYKWGSDSDVQFSMVVNAGNREKIVTWLETRMSPSLSLQDVTPTFAMIAVQGPKALAIVEPLYESDVPVSTMRYYTCASGLSARNGILISRTGYTGEDGVEIICHKEYAITIWEKLIEAASNIGGMAAGLGSRDTLRLEAAMPLYGHELSEAVNPIQAGLSFAVNLGGREFIGRAALERFAADKSHPVRIGLQLDGKRVARQGAPVLHGDEIVGEVTSGTYSPTFDRPIAMAYVRPTAAAVGTRLAVNIRGTQHAAVVVPLPFYERGKKS